MVVSHTEPRFAEPEFLEELSVARRLGQSTQSRLSKQTLRARDRWSHIHERSTGFVVYPL